MCSGVFFALHRLKIRHISIAGLFDLMTLKMSGIVLRTGMIFTKFETAQAICSRLIIFYC